MRREFHRTPGYDCIRTPCGKNGCGTRPGSGHGIHNDVWTYVVIDGDVALSLDVGSGIYPATVPQHIRDEGKIQGYAFHLHVAFPTKREQLLAGYEPEPEPCKFVGLCWGDRSWFGAASDFVQTHFVGETAEQPESFWKALEDQCAEWAKSERANRVDTRYERCMHCDGLGTVTKGDAR